MNMRLLLLTAFGGLIAVGVLLAVFWTAPSRVVIGKTSTSSDTAAIGSIIRDYLLANPEVLLEAMQELEKKQETQRDSVAVKAIKTYESELLRDGDSPIAGNPNGDVTIVEFMDYQCGYCKRVYNVMKSVVAADGKVKIIYKDLPILGEASRIAASAALAAARQNKYLALHDALMEFRAPLDRARILDVAASVGIDVPQLEKDMEAPEIKQIIERNLALASALGVRGTPAFVIGKRFVPGAVDADALKKLIADTRRG
jgi:protein-disulfide isomerase